MSSKYSQAEKLLRKYRQLVKTIELDQQFLDNMITIKGINYEGEKVQSTNAFHSGVEDVVVKRESIEERISTNKIITGKLELALNLLTQEEREIINLYYIEDLPWPIVAHNCKCSVRQCQRARKMAVYKLEKYLY